METKGQTQTHQTQEEKTYEPLYKPGEVMVLNTDNNILPFPSAIDFVDVPVTFYSDVDYRPGNFRYYLRNIGRAAAGEELVKTEKPDLDRYGKPIDYSKIKLVVVDTLTKLFEHILEHHKAIYTGKDLRQVFGNFQEEVKKLWIKLNKAPFPIVFFSHFEELQDEVGLIDRRAYVPGKAMAGKIEAEFSVVLAATPSRYEKSSSKRYRFQTAFMEGYTAKTPMGMFREDELHVPNDINFVIHKIKDYYPGIERIPNILVNGASGTGKSTSLHNLIRRESK